MAVVAAFELQDLLSAGDAACEAQSGHGCLGAGADESDLVDRWNLVAEQFGKFDFEGGVDAEGHSFADGFADGIDDDGGAVTEDQRTP